jgi:hypothetical protein
MTMKKYFVSIILFTVFISAKAQINLTLAFNNRPQPYLADWGNSINGRAIITLGQSPLNNLVKFKTTLTQQNGTVIGTTNLAAATLYPLNRLPATNLFTLGDVLQLQSMQFTGAAQNLLQQSGRLAAGAYSITVQVFDNRDSLLAERLSILNITGYQLPQLISPANNAELDAHVASAVITFRWTRLKPGTQELPQYRVQVFEILNDQTPMQAFRSSQPLLDEVATKGATQFIWRTNLPMIDSNMNRRFIWTVQTLDVNGNPIPTNDMNVQGRSEPAVFSIKQNTAAQSIKEGTEKNQ